MKIEDRSNLATINKILLIEDNLSIQGLNDPSLMRYTLGTKLNQGIGKQFFFYPSYADEVTQKPSSKLHAIDLGERLGKNAAEG
ncbi:hypothetical protein HZC08_01595, partial [Candidatus Micrarchaeota archaeon]|nr:hypothetical protein [Candidatus Micrarchaeota archaeon]